MNASRVGGSFSLILFDDQRAQQWEPFALTRPAGELLFGTCTTRERAELIFGVACAAHLGAEHLQGFEEAGAPPVRPLADVPTEGDRLFLSSRTIPDWGATLPSPAAPTPVQIRGETVGWFAPADSPSPPADFLRAPWQFTPEGSAPHALPGRVLENIWELVLENPEQIARDIRARFPSPQPAELPDGVALVGDYPLAIDPSARIEPGVVLDTSAGPIRLERDVSVRAFTRLAGPAFVGEGSTVLGGPVEAVSIGPVCKVRGELAESVCAGYVNKAHAGHIGHAYLGRWVNLGAETTNSDLKNNYGNVRIWTPEGERDTGSIKFGSLFGDHVKTGIGLLLNTGTVIGAGSNLFGAEMPPKYVPPFSWGSGDELVPYRLDKFLEVAERAMSRRDVALAAGASDQLRRAWKRGRGSEPGGGESGDDAAGAEVSGR